MISEKLVSIFGLVFVVSYVAKYVGPSIFGQISMSMSLFQIIQIISQFGSDVVIFKRVSKNHDSGVRLMKSTFPIRFFVYLLLSIPILIYAYNENSHSGFIFVLACFFACFFSSLDVYSLYFDSVLKSINNTFANVFGLLVSLLVRWLIVFFGLKYVYLSIPIVLSGLIPLVIRFFIFKVKVGIPTVIGNHKNKYQKYLLSTGFSFVTSTVSVAIYTRISMLILGYIDGSSVAGVFSIAATLSTSWAFILNSIIVSTLPSIFSEKDDYLAMIKSSRLSLLIVSLSFVVILFIYFFSGYFISEFYGASYSGARGPLIILSFSTMISALGTISARFIARSSGYAFLSKKMFFVAVVSCILNFLLINALGIYGAAFSTLITEILSLTVFNYFFMGGVVLKLHLNIFNLKNHGK